MSRTLYLIDGHAQIFRAYFAIRGGMTSPQTGEPTQAIFGFAGMLLKLFEEFRPHYVVMAIDMPGKTFRDELYDQYKATREPAPEDFGPQAERIFEMTRYFGIPIIGQEGMEADDIIATCTERVLADADNKDVNVRIVSKDKDLEQLLGDRVTMFDIHTDTTIDVAALKEKKEITPDQVIDVLTLIGDKVDNIPGVDGVGPKTAAKLINEFGTVENILANVDKLKGKRKENFEKAAAHLPLSKQLVTLKRDLDIDFSMEDAQAGAIDASSLKVFFKQMGFRRHLADLERLLDAPASSDEEAGETLGADDSGFAQSLFDVGSLDDDAGEGTAAAAKLSHADAYDYSAITTRKALEDVVNELRKADIIAVDTETVGLGMRADLCGICLAWKAEHAVYVPIRSPEPDKHLDAKTVLELLGPVLEDPGVFKTGHNLKYDLHVLRHAGVRMRGVKFDTMIAAALLNLPGQGMNDLSMSLLQHETIPISRLIGERGRGKTQKLMSQVPLDEITPYAAEDADISLRLFARMEPEIGARGLKHLCDDVETPLISVLADMEYTGIRLDPSVLEEQKRELTERIYDLRDEIRELADDHDFNVDSPKQLGDVLFKKMKLPVIKRNKSGPSTDFSVLQRLAEHADLTPEQRMVPRLVIDYREFTKLVSTYLDQLVHSINEETGRVHTSFSQTSTATGRLSSNGPNLQNIPIRRDAGRQIRKAFVAAEGHRLICVDYSQIELRILAHLSEDAELIKAFKEGQDIHRAVASQVFDVKPEDVTSEQRGHAKTINFGIIYGVTAFGLSSRIEGLDVSAADELITNYRARFKGIDLFLNECIAEAERHGYVTTMLGRRRLIDQIKSRSAQTRALGERLAINSVVQGSAADLIKLAMVNLHARIADDELPLRLLVQVHDELVCEAPEADTDAMAAIVREVMESAMDLKVPLIAESGIGDNWMDAK